MVQIIQPVDNFDKVSPSRYCLVFQSLQSFGRNIFIEDELGVFCDEKILMWLPVMFGVVDSDDSMVDGSRDDVNDDDNVQSSSC